MVESMRKTLVAALVAALIAALVAVTGPAALTAASAGAAPSTVAFDLVGSASQNLVSFTDDPAIPFTSPGDGFQKYQRGVSPSIPFAVLDDSLTIFPGDTLGIIKDGNTDEFFGVVDTENPDNAGPVTATWVFNIAGASDLGLSIDMGAMGDFESTDSFDFQYSIDGGPSAPAFSIATDQTISQTYTLEGGLVVTLNDPLVADGTVLSNDLQTISTPLSGTGNELTLTLTVVANGGSEGFAFQNVVIEGGGGASGPPFGTCGDDTETPIHDVQGAGLASPVAGTSQVVEGVVVGDYQDTVTELGGFFIQEEDADADADSATSEGLFIADNGFGVDVVVGDVVRAKGNVSEAGTLTQLSGLSDVEICTAQSGVASAAAVTLPVASVDVFETTEGMSVSFSQTLYASGNFTQGRFGEVDLSVGGPLDNPTNVVAPGASAIALQDLNNRSRIQLDDGSRVESPLPLPPYLGSGNTLRTGDTLPGLNAVMSFAGVYELQPTGPITFTRANPRLDPPVVGGSITVAAYNVLNYFTTLDNAGAICGPLGNQGCRGADNAFELGQQRAKLVTAISKLDADIVGLMEIENGPGDVPTADLVAGLNDATAPGTYDYVATGAVGTDAIRVAVIYKPASVTPVGPFAVLDSSVDPNFIDTKNRPVVAQTFQENGTDDVVTVAVNHLKSKGSDCNDVGDPDLGDGQGNCNGTRNLAAQAMVDWLATDPTGAGGDQYLIIGDLNSYAQEDPIVTIENGGYTDLIEAFVGTGFAAGAYSFNFFSQSGYLDHGLASPGVLPRVTGAAFWHVNADEPRALDYNDFNQPDLFSPDEFRSSDHDPVVIGVCETTAPVVDVTVSPDSMWPPNHKLVDVAATVTVTDADPNATITLVSVTSNEPDDGLGDGDTEGDIVIVDDFNFELRAERSALGDGRVYTITYEVTDACGNSTVASATVTVPLNQS